MEGFVKIGYQVRLCFVFLRSKKVGRKVNLTDDIIVFEIGCFKIIYIYIYIYYIFYVCFYILRKGKSKRGSGRGREEFLSKGLT